MIDDVIRSLKSGKEATVYLVRSGAHTRCAKVNRDMRQRSFQKRARYQEGRKVRGSRHARAMAKSTRFGRKEQEAAWKNTGVFACDERAADADSVLAVVEDARQEALRRELGRDSQDD